MVCFHIGQMNIHLFPLDQWGQILARSLGNGLGMAQNECWLLERRLVGLHNTILYNYPTPDL